MSKGRLHIVTDDEVLARPGFLGVAEAVLEAGGSSATFHLRGHATSGGSLYAVAIRLLDRARAVGARLLVNDRVDIALAAGADGVQLGRRGLPVSRVRRLAGSRLVGYSAHSAEEAASASRSGADFVLVGTIFRTASHPGAAAGPGLVRACAAADLPVVAIGGVTPDRVRELVDAGASGVAVRGGIWDAVEPAAAVARFLEVLERN